jgi:hypothetical protein
MEPVRQNTHGVAANPAKETLDPDLDPTSLSQTAHLTKIKTMADNLQNSS